MKRFGLMAGVLTVGILFSACSQAPAEVKGGLEPQFGTTQDDSASAVAIDPNLGRVYVAGTLAQDAELPVEQGGNLVLRSYSLAGRYLWNKTIVKQDFPDPLARGVGVDAAGNVYLAWYEYSTDGYSGATLVKFSSARKVLYEVKIDNGINGFEVDSAGNVYISGIADRDGLSERDFLRKYDSKGRLVWERATLYDNNYEPIITARSIPTPYDIGLAEDGSLYVTGYRNLTKYSSTGRTLWKLPIDRDSFKVTAGAKDAYIAAEYSTFNKSDESYTSSVKFKKVDRTGSITWSQNVKLPGEGYLGDIGTDDRDNVYLTGFVSAPGSDTELFVSKYTRMGKLNWLYVPRNTADYEGAEGTGIAVQGKDVYVAGSTNGEVNGKNKGNNDAFLLKLNARGQKVWER